MARLADLIKEIQYDSNWEIWADAPFIPQSEARYSQRLFKNGGPQDGKEFFATGETCGDFLSLWESEGGTVTDEELEIFIAEVATTLEEYKEDQQGN